MKKVTIIGCFAINHQLYDGQTIKTITISEELKEIFGEDEVGLIDTYMWKKKIWNLLFITIKNFYNSENIIMLPAKNGLVLFAPLLSILKCLFNRKLHYVVIGGWLHAYLTSRKYLVRYLKKFDGIFVETNKMKESLDSLGLTNILVMPNFKRVEKVELKFNEVPEQTFRFCTFSRVMKEKGITDAIELVNNLNIKGTKCELDIYGKINEEFIDEFYELINNSYNIKYLGAVNPTDSVKVLNEYDAMLFLTYYDGEGFPGTLIDALFAGLPVLATDWKYNSEIVIQGKTGFLIKVGDQKKFEACALKLINDIELINEMRMYCSRESSRYLSSKVIRCLSERM